MRRVTGRALAAALLTLPASALAAPDANGARPVLAAAAPGATAADHRTRATPAPTVRRTHTNTVRCQPPPTADLDTAPLEQARALAQCLTSQDGTYQPPNSPTAEGDTSVTARTMKVSGLMCPLSALTGALCHAQSVTLQDAEVAYGSGAGVCLSAPTVVTSGDIRLAAHWITGRLLGLLPVGFSTSVLPPVPIPYAALTDVHIRGLRLRADEITAVHGRIDSGRACGRDSSAI
ncbi:hypothetical protein GCM10010211_75910 [Streptomyces albospinus]|uniref:Secreted protein n=1 Tax=Streptomyces albospinus TaxID=285515 RepID=A0ABQ2VLS7_9ACTN|nr:hypothetical protein [Streptomyces albospinus]GGU97432.1 hypothetical protein GCM10010211_75910 [Streptomyces albospinus]